MKDGILELNGLSMVMLECLSYESKLGIPLKQNLHYFDKESLIAELVEMAEYFDGHELLSDSALDYRIKSLSSIMDKYDRYYPDHQARKVFNDILGFRAFCDSYEDVLKLDTEKFRIADMSQGKASDDGYRGVHVYFQCDGKHYPIEIQFNTLFDRQLNNWLHDYLYKKDYPDSLGATLRKLYEAGKIKNKKQFEEAMEDVLLDRS